LKKGEKKGGEYAVPLNFAKGREGSVTAVGEKEKLCKCLCNQARKKRTSSSGGRVRRVWSGSRGGKKKGICRCTFVYRKRKGKKKKKKKKKRGRSSLRLQGRKRKTQLGNFVRRKAHET